MTASAVYSRSGIASPTTILDKRKTPKTSSFKSSFKFSVMAAAFCGCASGFGRAAESHFCTQCLKWLCKWLCWVMQWLWAGAQWLCKLLWPGASSCALACIGCGEWLCKWLAEWLCKWPRGWLQTMAVQVASQLEGPSIWQELI